MVRRPDPLHEEEWAFSYSDRIGPQLFIRYYWRRERATKRHKFRNVDVYDHIDCGRYAKTNTTQEPPLPEDVREEVHRRFSEQLRVTRFANGE